MYCYYYVFFTYFAQSSNLELSTQNVCLNKTFNYCLIVKTLVLFEQGQNCSCNTVYIKYPTMYRLRIMQMYKSNFLFFFVEAMYAMEISVEKDKQTGETKILSTSAVSPEWIHQRGVKVYDDGTKVVYEARSGVGTTTMENGVHPWSASDVDELIHRVGQSQTIGVSERGAVSPRAPTTAGSGNLGQQKEQMVHKEAKLEMVHNPEKGGFGNPKYGFDEVTDVPDATSEKPVTMIFMGYHNVEDEEETKKLLGYDGTIKAEIVLIDEDDEKSLREKTVTDISTMDGNAADLVSGCPLSDTTEPSSEGKDESLAKEAPPAGIQKKKRCRCCTVM